MSLNDQNFESYVPVYDTVPEEWEQARPFLVEVLKKISNAVNIREIGWLLDEEVLSGKSFIPGATLPGNNPSLFRSVLRKVIIFGALPNNSAKSVPHGLNVDSNFTLINLYGAASDPVNLQYVPLPYAEPTSLTNEISLQMDSTNVKIVTGASVFPRSNYTRSYVVIEYIQEL